MCIAKRKNGIPKPFVEVDLLSNYIGVYVSICVCVLDRYKHRGDGEDSKFAAIW